jgi:TPR repeat protein
VAVSFAASPARAGFADAAAAYDRGDLPAAAAEWQRLAAKGDPLAQVALADLYMTGQGVARDPAKARDLYRQAARQGNRVAQLNLGDIHARGHGVPADPVRAYAWFSLAAQAGSEWASERVEEISTRLTEEELKEAEEMAAALRREGQGAAASEDNGSHE